MEDYLRWLDNKMRGRKILPLLDNFSGHELGVQLVGGLDGLQTLQFAGSLQIPPLTGNLLIRE
jgi:hypothetical protein